MPKFHSRFLKFSFLTVFVIAFGCTSIQGVSQTIAKDHPQYQIKDSIVKIYSVIDRPDYYQPWRMTSVNSVSGSGCIISGNRILTNAHVIADSTFIQVRRYGEARRYRAHAEWVSHQVDLAILSVENTNFFKDTRALEISDLPDTQQEVLVYGFPIGGDSLSITKGILSRIEHQYYAHSSSYRLAGQIDAAINPGNSGGPVIVGNKIVGVVMQAFGSNVSENIGYMVPTPIIKHFFKDIADKRLDGFPNIGLGTQRLENPGLKKRYNMPENLTGLLVNYVYSKAKAKNIIEIGDIILAVNSHTIEDDGTVEIRPKERTWFTYYIDLHQTSESITLKILRNGDIMEVEVPLNNTINDYLLIPMEQYDRLPRYFIYGGVVMCPLTKNLIMQWGKNWRKIAPVHFINALAGRPSEDRTEIVVVLQVLAADITVGYLDIRNWLVDEINGKKIKDFNDAVSTILSAQTPFISLKDERGFELTIDRAAAEANQQKILDRYSIKADRSLDLQK